MKKNVLLVMWLALAALFTVTTMSACSDDDNNENGNVGGVTIDGVDQAEYFRQNLGLFTETDSLGCSFLKVLDELTPTVFTYFVDDEEMAETLFLAWIPEQAQASVVRDGSTIVYTPRDAQGAPQGTITFRKALPTETATLAVVELKGVSKIKGMDKIKFQPESARPDNGGNYLPPSISLSDVKKGKWFWGYIQWVNIVRYNNFTLYYACPKLMEGRELVELVGNGYLDVFGFQYFCLAVNSDYGFFSRVVNLLKDDDHYFIVSGGYDGKAGHKFAVNKLSLKDNVKLTTDGQQKEIAVSPTDTTKYWVWQGYAFKDGSTNSYVP